MGPLLPLFVDGFLLGSLFFFHLLGDFLSRFVPFLRHDSTLPVNFLQLILFLLGVPFHDSLPFDVLDGFFIWDHVHRYIFQEVFLALTPQGRCCNLVFNSNYLFLLDKVLGVLVISQLRSLLFLVFQGFSLYLAYDRLLLFLSQRSIIVNFVNLHPSFFAHLYFLLATFLLQFLIILQLFGSHWNLVILKYLLL